MTDLHQLRELLERGGSSAKLTAGRATPREDPREALGGGVKLDPRTRARMEAAFGRNLSDVRVHDDTAGAAVAARYGAAAVTVGRHVVFGAGRYRPGTPIGDALIAHELAHVSQQGSDAAGLAAVEPAWPTRRTTAPVERDSDRSARLAMEDLYAPAPGGGETRARGWARPRRSLGAVIAPSGCEPPKQCEQPCEGPATCTIDSAVRPLAGRGALRLKVEGHTCIQAGHAELYRYEGESPERCNFSDALQPPIMMAPVALGCFEIVTPTTLTMVPGVGHNVLVRVVDATDHSNTAIACATVTAS